MINFSKSSVIFSVNVPEQVKPEMASQMQMRPVDNPGKYLGIPSFWGKSKCEAMGYIKDRIVQKLQGWKICLLS